VSPPHRVVVTGANGQVGWELVRTLQPLAEVIPLTRAELDLSDLGQIDEVLTSIKPTLICNAAAYTAVDGAESDHEAASLINARAPGVIGSVALRLGAAVIHFSTDYVFDGETERPYEENDATNPLNVYGRTKRYGECALSESGAAHLTLRTSWVYGLRGHNFLRSILRLARDRDTLRVVADQHGTPTWARWLAESTAQIVNRAFASGDMLEMFRERGGILHVTGAGETTWHGFASAILKIARKRDERRTTIVEAISAEEYPTPATRPRRTALNSCRAEREFGLRRTHWMDQLRLALDEGMPE
jgi:dTDP-4-dehydrorhamnose reductase